MFEYSQMGRYAWLYIIVPFWGAFVAALFAKKHMELEKKVVGGR